MCELGDLFMSVGLPQFQSTEPEEGQPAPVGSFRSPRTGMDIVVLPKKGESASHAMDRVRRRHRGD